MVRHKESKGSLGGHALEGSPCPDCSKGNTVDAKVFMRLAHCPSCQHAWGPRTDYLDRVLAKDGKRVVRIDYRSRRACGKCGHTEDLLERQEHPEGLVI